MNELINKYAAEFSAQVHGSTNYDKDTIFVMGESVNEYVPLSYLIKKEESINTIEDLQNKTYLFSSCDFLDNSDFNYWFHKQFSKKLLLKESKEKAILHYPNQKVIFDAVSQINKSYITLRENYIINNGKNFPIQLGEWYAKCIFGLKQVKSTSQRGFDFIIGNGKKVEVKVHWNDISSPKGVKVKKTLVELSDYTIVLYVGKNLMIRDVLFLDSIFVSRKFAGKGHTIFLKDNDVSNYFFSKSIKQHHKIVNKNALMKYANPNLAIKLAESLE